MFRLSVGAVLLAVFYLVDAPRIVGETDETLAWRALIGLLAAGCVFLVLLQRRTPSTGCKPICSSRPISWPSRC